LLVKTRLSAGEQREMFTRMYARTASGAFIESTDGRYQINPQAVGPTKIATYLLDWSLKDAAGQPVIIRDQPIQAVLSALDALDPDEFREIDRAIDAHEEAMDAERAAQKKILPGATPSAPISPSLVAAAGATSGSAT
jgi:hypothetical protein